MEVGGFGVVEKVCYFHDAECCFTQIIPGKGVLDVIEDCAEICFLRRQAAPEGALGNV